MRLIIIICLLLSSSCLAQFRPKVKVEVGLNSFGFGRSSKMGRGTESLYRIASPLVGVALQHDVSARSYASVGVQYTATGAGESYYSKWFSPLDQYYHIVHESETIKLYKLVIPFTVGHRISIRKVRASFFGGVKAIRYTRGRYQYHYTLEEDGNTTIDRHKSYNPFNNNSISQQGRRTNYEVFLGADVSVYKTFSLGASFSVPRYMVTFEEQPSMFGAPYTEHHYYRPDILVSLSWIVQRKN